MTTFREPQRTRSTTGHNPTPPRQNPARPTAPGTTAAARSIPTRSSPKRGLNISGTQMALIMLVIIGLSVIIDFNRKIQSGQRITGEANEMRDEVGSLMATKSALATELAYVSSDAYVQYWAHSDGRYIQSNEVLVVPVPAKKATIATPTSVQVIQKPPSNFEIWWALFFEPGP